MSQNIKKTLTISYDCFYFNNYHHHCLSAEESIWSYIIKQKQAAWWLWTDISNLNMLEHVLYCVQFSLTYIHLFKCIADLQVCKHLYNENVFALCVSVVSWWKDLEIFDTALLGCLEGQCIFWLTLIVLCWCCMKPWWCFDLLIC